MTALQDWLPIRPMDPRSLKALICDAIRGLNPDESPKAAEPEPLHEPTLMGRGLERC